MPMNTRHKNCSKKYSWPIPSSTKVCVFSRASIPFFSQIHLLVSAPQEATLDSAFLVTASNMHAAKARAMKAGAGAFDVDDFVSKLITFMGGRRGEAGPKDRASGGTDEDDEEEEDYDGDDEPLDWEKIGRKALAKSRRVPVMDFMYVPPLNFFWFTCWYARVLMREGDTQAWATCG